MRNAINLKKDEVIINTFEGELDLKKDGKAILVTLVLTNQNFVFLEEGKGALLTVTFESVAKVSRSISRLKSITILPEFSGTVKFSPLNMDNDSLNKLCILIPKLISARKKATKKDAYSEMNSKTC